MSNFIAIGSLLLDVVLGGLVNMGPVDPKVDLDQNENMVISFLEETYIRFNHKIFCKFLVQS